MKLLSGFWLNPKDRKAFTGLETRITHRQMSFHIILLLQPIRPIYTDFPWRKIRLFPQNNGIWVFRGRKKGSRQHVFKGGQMYNLRFHYHVKY